MRKAFLFFSMCSLLLSSCSGDDNDTTNSGNTITLPIAFDFRGVTVPDNATSIDLNDINVKAGNTYHHTTGWTDCADSNNAVLENVTYDVSEQSAIAIGTGNYNTLIADIGNLPAIQKIIIDMASYGMTRISLCDGNNVIAENNIGESQNGRTTVTLNVNNKKADKLYIGCLEGGLYSIRIE
ncbi:hypothetical protein E6C50_01100 [Flavobacterium supellecticarium]|uniref:Uncharacterized protein n=1 Tax=Flavobacterium supellecticarium TaxID=2565924 RepID=A0A4S4A3H8_9FLAO|nr:hypothetical protein [Flavobacterium supellecticarium]THF52838.1 hypothetical protein E6C50_01100 [Flavobacterium supellecticarium]